MNIKLYDNNCVWVIKEKKYIYNKYIKMFSIHNFCSYFEDDEEFLLIY